MKTALRTYNSSMLFSWVATTLVAGLLISTDARAGEPTVVKKKTYSKSYTVSASDKVSFTNQFGELKINTWDKNEVKVDVTITAEANSDEKAQLILDRINIEDGKNGGDVYFKTKFAKENQKWEKGEKQSFHIDYVAYVPARNALTAQNEFGPMVLGDHNGEVSLQCKFGTLTTGKLANVKKLHVEFGKANIGGINNGNVDIKFSKASIENLGGDVKFNFEFCDVAKLKVDNDTKELVIRNKFSHLYVDVTTNFSANFDITTSFGELKNKTSFPIKEEGKEDDGKRHGPKFDKRYTGKSGGGSTDMKIKSEYGQVTLGHNLNVNMDKKENNNNNNNRDRDRDQERKERTEKKAKKTTAI